MQQCFLYDLDLLIRIYINILTDDHEVCNIIFFFINVFLYLEIFDNNLVIKNLITVSVSSKSN